MSPTSVAFRRAVFAPETDEVVLMLLTISGAGLPIPLRFVNNSADVVSRGNTYLAYPFQVALPDEREDSPAQVSLIIDNIDQHIVAAVRALDERPTIKIEVVLASSPDEVERGAFECSLHGVTMDAMVVRGQLAYEEVLTEGYPADSYDPTRFGGLFAG